MKNSWNKEPYAIRRMLTETSVRASDRRAAFVGVEAYEAAGGVVLRDLFQGDEGGWLEDPALLDRLVFERLQAEAEVLASEGWKWIEVATDLPYGYSHGLRRLAGDPAPMTVEESATHATLLTEYRALEEEYPGQDEYPEEIDARLGQLEMAMEALEQRPLIYDPAEIARAGVFVTLDRDGSLAIYRGYVRPEDEPREETAVHGVDGAGVVGQGGDVGVSSWKPSATSAGGTVITSGGQPVSADASEEEDDGALKPLPERLVMELTAHRTLALREAIGRSPDVALTLLLLKLVTDTFRTSSATGSCLEASVRHVYMSAQATDLKDSVVAKLVDERHAAWEADLPLGDDAALWDYLTALDQGRGAGSRSRHGRGWLGADGGWLSQPCAQGPDPRGRARGEGRGDRAAARSPEEGRDGNGGRAASQGQRLVARGAAPGRSGRTRRRGHCRRAGGGRGPARRYRSPGFPDGRSAAHGCVDDGSGMI